MGIPPIKRKKLHFKSIEFFSKCVIKYFQPIVSKVLTEETDNYGGMETALAKFQDKIYTKLQEDGQIGLNGTCPRISIKRKMNKKNNMLNDDDNNIYESG